ncbi:hypothetical protein GQ457_18G013610 [Hibiscus cannabinus]
MVEVDGCHYKYRVHLIAPSVSPCVWHHFDAMIFFGPHYPLNPPKIMQITFIDSCYMFINFFTLVMLHERWDIAFIVTDIHVAILGFLCASNSDNPQPD